MIFLLLLLFVFLGYKTMTEWWIYSILFVILSFISIIYFVWEVTQVAEQNLFLRENNLFNKR